MKDRAFHSPRQGLITDLYQLTMAAAYYDNNVDISGTFELFVRNLPESRSYLIVAGLEHAVQYLLALKFHDEEIEYLRSLDTFKTASAAFWRYLHDFHFTGDVWAVPEGTVIFADEPMLRLRAPIIEAQIVETFLLSAMNFQTMVASKAARVVQSACGKPVVDFGTRRAHGPEAGILAARASYIGGCIGTSNVEAGFSFGIPVFGTAAHSFTMAFDNEEDSFQSYYRVFPESTTLLIDTYDTIKGAKKACTLGSGLKGVRLDSGDILTLSKKVRTILDEAGLREVKIVASGDLNEYKIDNLLQNGAPIDIFGVGTEMVTSKDAPALGGIYKLVECERNGVITYKSKFSDEKVTYPGSKQLLRCVGQPE
jgi:nicotinate phosphoribosyltransferase